MEPKKSFNLFTNTEIKKTFEALRLQHYFYYFFLRYSGSFLNLLDNKLIFISNLTRYLIPYIF